jgi:hypothetical protein
MLTIAHSLGTSLGMQGGCKLDRCAPNALQALLHSLSLPSSKVPGISAENLQGLTRRARLGTRQHPCLGNQVLGQVRGRQGVAGACSMG